MKDFKQNRKALDKELEKFVSILQELLPRYSFLMEKKEITSEELAELGEIEHYLIEINSKISTIKNILEQNLFGNSFDIYFKLKNKAKMGDLTSIAKLERMRENFEELIINGSIFNWN